jgi:hypothetical protein
MNTLRSLLPKLGANAIPLWGLAFGGWSAPTALIIYWCDNFIGALLISLRIFLQQRLTSKRGHFHPQLNTNIKTGSAKNVKTIPIKSFFAEFLSTSLIFTLAHGVFLGLLLNTIFQSPPENDALRTGILGVVAFNIIGFLIDLIGLKVKPFIWIKQLAGALLGHVVLVHLAIIGGMAFAAFTNSGNAFFVPFAAFKLLADLTNDLSLVFNLDGSPDWLIYLVRRVNPRSNFADYLAREWKKDQVLIAQDEEVVTSA